MAQSWLGQTHKLRRLAFELAALVTTVMLLAAWTPSILSRLETLSLDLRFKIRGERSASGQVVLVAIDEPSLREVAQWPWPRDLQAQLVEKISSDGAAVIGLDIIYSEPESNRFLRELRELRSALTAAGLSGHPVQHMVDGQLIRAETDPRLVRSLANAGNIVLAFPLLVPDATSRPGAPVLSQDFRSRSYFTTVKGAGSPEELQPYAAAGVVAPLSQFAATAMAMGHVYSIPDWDGVTRYEYVALRYDGQYYPSFALEIARAYLGVPRERMILHTGEGVQLGTRFIPTDRKSRLLINYLGRERSFPYVSATDVLHDRVPKHTFRNRIVLVGTAALGTYDQKITPFSNNYPGFEKNATVVENILEQQFLTKTLWSGPLDVAIILLFGLGLGYVLPRQGALPGAALALVALGAYALLAQHLFVSLGVWIEGVIPLLTVILTFIVIVVLRFMTEERQSREIREMFSSYVSPQVVEELIKDPTKATTGGVRREVTMLFADLVNFTRLNEEREAEEVVTQLNEYLTAMTEVIFHWHGTLDKFVGDGIVAFWGAPLDQPNHVELAVKCALHMHKRLEELQVLWRAQGKTIFTCGIGLNTGAVVVGNIGAQGKKMDYTVIGDHVNLTARVEGLTREFRYAILVTEYTAHYIRELVRSPGTQDNRGHLAHVALRKLGSVKVKGKDKSVVVYGLESLQREESSQIDEHSTTTPEIIPIASPTLLK